MSIEKKRFVYKEEPFNHRLQLLKVRLRSGKEAQRELKNHFVEKRQRLSALFSSESDLAKITELSASYPEMGMLTVDVAASPESGTSSDKPTLGEQLLGLSQDATKEFDRTATSLLNLGQVLRGDYEAFTDCQTDSSTRLTKESFAALQSYTRKVLGYNRLTKRVNPDKLDAMITYLVINDLGKINAVVEEVESRTGKKEQDHDAVLLTALSKYPSLSPSFQRLVVPEQKIIIDSLKPNFNIGQLIQGENVPASLNGLAQLKQDALDFYLLHAIFDIAGARGQFIQNGSAIMTEPTWKGFQSAITAIEGLSRGETPDTAYKNFLDIRAKQLGFSVDSPQNYALARIACMMRLSTVGEMQAVRDALEALPTDVRQRLEGELRVSGTNDTIAILPYYAPALLTNIRRTVEQEGTHDAVHKSAQIGLEALARVYTESRSLLLHKRGLGIYTVDIASLAKRAAENPQSILTDNLTISAHEESAKVEIA